MLNTTDKFLVNDGSTTETVTWADFKAGLNPLVISVVLTPSEPVVNNQVIAAAVVTGGTEPRTITGYQWHTSDDNNGTNQVNIPGATSNTYTPVSADADKLLGCTVTAVDADGTTGEGTGYASLVTDIGLELAQPEVLTPKKGAGIGGDVTYTPETSAITTVDEIKGGGVVDGAEANNWRCVVYGDNKFVAIGRSGNYIMYSDDGVTWTNSGVTGISGSNYWEGIAYGNGKYVAVAGSGTSRLMHSSDGKSWSTSGVTGVDDNNNWQAVTYADNKFVAVANNGTAPRTMYSSNGINWNAVQAADESLNWNSVTYGKDKFVAVANNGSGVRAMYSNDGTTWSNVGISGVSVCTWNSVTYADNKFVAVASGGTSTDNRIMHSNDGVAWTSIDPPDYDYDMSWQSVAYGNGVFVAVAYEPYENQVMYSLDGENWQLTASAEIRSWNTLTYGNDKFVVLPFDNSNRVMYSFDGVTWDESTKLTFTDDKAYNADDGTEMTTIDQAFKKGDKVVGNGDITLFANTAAFSTTTYRGNGATQSIKTGIDNTGKSMLWIKCRSFNFGHHLADTERGLRYLGTESSLAENSSYDLDSYDSDGYTVTNRVTVTNATQDYVAWNFRAAPGFFDIVTYEGDDQNGREVPHSLNAKPGFFIVKNITSGSTNWVCYHQELGSSAFLKLDLIDTASQGSDIWNNTEPTDTVFTVQGSSNNIRYNKLGEDYVAYLFADTPGLIKCGSYTGSSSGVTENCGFKPGWVLIKSSDDTEYWCILDRERNDQVLIPNTSDKETNFTSLFEWTDTGFKLSSSNSVLCKNGKNYIYVAIAENASAGQFMPTGVLTEDADKTNKQMTLTDVTGEWKPGLTAVNTEEVTENAPCGDDIVFTSSKPATTVGTVTTWGAADWELTNKDTNDTQTASVTLKGNVDAEPGPTSFTLEDDTNYSVRVQYSSADPAGGPSEWSDVNNFKTCEGGDGWKSASSGEDGQANQWLKIAYGNGIYVAVSTYIGPAGRVMYSTNATDWTLVTVPEDNNHFNDVAFGNGTFVAVAGTGTNRIMYSTDAINWTTVAAPEDNSWQAITYGNGKFVAVASSGTWRVMHADENDLNTWSKETSSQDLDWRAIAYGGGKFVATSNNGTKQIMYADENDLSNWTGVQPHESGYWRSIAYGDGKFVALNVTGTQQVAYSTNGSSWTAATPAEQHPWEGITYGNDKFVAVATHGGGPNQIMYSTDGVNWEAAASPEENSWSGVTYGGDKFVAVARGGGNNIMYSFTGAGAPATTLFYDENNADAVSDVTLERRYGVDANDTDLRKHGIFPLTEQPTYEVAAYVKEGDKYTPIRSYKTEVNQANQQISEMQAAFETRIAALES